VGQEVDARYVCDQIGQLRDGEQLMSGDYSDATNNLAPWASEAVAEEIATCLGLDETESSLLLRALTRHEITDPEDKKHVKRQTWGQLMGSIVSFPILCIINATVMKRAREHSVWRPLTLKTANVIVNGDDCLARLTPLAFQAWKVLGKSIGLSESVGKTYFSNRFCNINSARFLVVPDYCQLIQRSIPRPEGGLKVRWVRGGPPLWLEHRPYVNMGLCLGLKRSTKGSTEKVTASDLGTGDSFGAIAHELVRTCPVSERERAMKLFINHNWETLKQTHRPWFLPEHLGGLGLPSFGSFEPTKKDLRVAAVIFNHFPMPRRPPVAEWKVWEYATSRMEDFKEAQRKSTLYAMEATFQKSESGTSLRPISEEALMGRFCVEALFTKKGIKDLFSDEGIQQRKKYYLKQTDKVYKKALNSRWMATTEPFAADSLPHKPHKTTGGKVFLLQVRHESVSVPDRVEGEQVPKSWSQWESIVDDDLSHDWDDRLW